MRLDTAPQRPLGGDHHEIRIDPEGRDSEPFEMGAPGHLTDEATIGMLAQASDHRGGQCAFAHVGERLGIDDVVVVAGAQQREEVEAVLGGGGSEPGEVQYVFDPLNPVEWSGFARNQHSDGSARQ